MTTRSPTAIDESLMAKLFAECLGTFFLLLTISMVVIQAADLSIVAPLAIGFTLTALVYAFGPISGAHFNPAVTLGLYFAGRHPKSQVAPYLVAECVGALLAAFVALYLRGQAQEMVSPEPAAGFVAEGIWTFLLVCVILQITSKRNDGNQWFGIVVGTTVAGGAYVMGSVSGAAFNPAVWLGLAIEGKLGWEHWWIYIFAPIVGGGLAAACQCVLEPGEATPIEPM
ncbi:MAG: aquaporin family protein [Phycisphaerales bacterium]|nr:aquaporin family protein [Phycisphaerales bacterium]